MKTCSFTRYRDASLMANEMAFIQDACLAGDIKEVRQVINDLYGQGIRRCNMMQSFLSNDIDQAREKLLKHYQSMHINRIEKQANVYSGTMSPVLVKDKTLKRGQASAANELFAAASSGDLFRLQRAIQEVC